MVKKRAKRRGNDKLAIGYVRVSKEEQGLGPEAQRAAIESWATAHGVTVVEVFEDRLTGATPVDERPGMLDALRALEAHGAGVLVAAKRDRLSRETVITVTVEALAKNAGAHVVTADGTDSDDESPDGVLRRLIADMFAQYERALIRTRTKAALAVKKSREERTGTLPWGKQLGPDGRTLVPCEREVAIAERARYYRSIGRSVAWIAKQLASEGMLSRNGQPLSVATVWKMTHQG